MLRTNVAVVKYVWLWLKDILPDLDEDEQLV